MLKCIKLLLLFYGVYIYVWVLVVFIDESFFKWLLLKFSVCVMFFFLRFCFFWFLVDGIILGDFLFVFVFGFKLNDLRYMLVYILVLKYDK